MTATHSLIAPTANPLLERALRDTMSRRHANSGSLGELEPLAIRLGLIQNTLKPRLHDPQLVLIAGDHGLAVEGLAIEGGPTTAVEVRRLLSGHVPVAVLAACQGMALTVVDAGTAERIEPHDKLLIRKIAHGTRNTRVTQAMSVDQAQAALKAGMEIGESLPGNVVACAGLGIGSDVSAALVLSRLSGMQARELLLGSARVDASLHSRLTVLAQTALARHRDASDPIEVLAAFGGFEVAMLAGLMLSAAQQRRLVMVDGIVASTALLVASRIADAVIDYCVFCRSQQHLGFDAAMRLFQSGALLELNLNSRIDGCGAAMSWPLVNAASALLTEWSDDEEAAPQRSTGTGFLPLSLGVKAGEPAAAAPDKRTRAARDDSKGADAQGWHSAFNQRDRDNVDASAKIDTQVEPRTGPRR